MDAALPADLAALSAAVRAYTERPVGAAPEAGSQDVLQLECKRALINRLELDFARDAATLEAVWHDDGSMDSGASAGCARAAA